MRNNQSLRGLWAGLMVWCVVLAGGGTAVLALSSTRAEAQSGTIIREIRVVGNKRVEPETVRSYLQLSVGSPYDSFAADQSVQTLFGTGLFSDVRIDREGGIVTVLVEENPVINRVAFEGNSEIDDNTLASEVQLKPRAIFTRAKVQADVQRILDVYRRSGQFSAQVEPKLIALPHNRVDLVFEISEGATTKVVNLNFIGNSAFSDSQLKDVITTSEKSFLSFLKSTDIYDPDRLNLDRELLRQFYLKNGYADVVVVSAIADLAPDGKGFFVTFTVEEGQPYTFGAVTIQSNLASLDVDALQSDISTVQGDTFNASKIDSSVERITLAVAEQGFAFARVRPQADRDPFGRTIGITYVVEEGPRVYIERIDIVGNTRTLDYVIRREIPIAEGDAFNTLLVDRARRKLQALGFFKKVEIKRFAGSAPDRITLAIEVEEQSTGELSFGAGYSSAEGVIGDIAISERNLMGRGQFLRLKLSGSLERQQIDLSFTEPRFMDTNIAAGFDAFHRELDFSEESNYIKTETGGSVRLGFPITDDLRLTTRYTFSAQDIQIEGGSPSPAIRQLVDPSAGCDINTGTGCADSRSFIQSGVGYSLAYDTRDLASNPSRGVYFVLSQDLAGVGGDVNFVRTTAELTGYYPVAEGWVLVGRATAGNIFGFGGDDVLLVDNFFKGGETIRGFARAGFGAREAPGANCGQGTGNDCDALGGTTFAAITAELRFPLPFLPEELGMSGAVFADAGTLFGTDLEGIAVDDEASIRSSVGASLLWKSPVGPLRADFAYVLSKEDFDEEEFFRFGAATRF